MTPNQRIALNVAATYGRSVLGVACGIFSTRWVLNALGHEDFGLYGLIGGVTLFISFLNIQFSLAVSRYYACAIGEAQVCESRESGLRECQAWFSSALFVHSVLPVCLVAIGYPLGIYAMENGYIEVPTDRISECVWIWRFTVCASFIGMITAPFQAMYTAKQYIAELTIYSFAQVIIKTIGFYYMACHPGEWLVKYGLFMCMIVIVPQIIICIRAWSVFEECHVRWEAFISFQRIKKLGVYAFWQALGGLGYIASRQCFGVLINNHYGPRVTGSFAVGQTVAGEAAALTGALQNSFTPAIASAYGAGDLIRMREMSYCVCKIGVLFTLMFALPMALEMDEILKLWLINPPPFANEICIATITFILIEKFTSGHVIAINATGNIALFQLVHGLSLCSVLIFAFIPACLGGSAAITAYTMPISCFVVIFSDVVLARSKAGLSFRYWFGKIFMPLIFVGFAGILTGMIPRIFADQSFVRILLTATFCLPTIFGLAWWLVLTRSERTVLLNQINKVIRVVFKEKRGA